MCGTFAGVEGGNNPLSTYFMLELNEDKTRLLKKLLICQQLAAEVNGMPKDVILELRFNDNPVVSDAEKALVGGGFIEETLRIRVLSNNKIKMSNTVLRRRQ